MIFHHPVVSEAHWFQNLAKCRLIKLILRVLTNVLCPLQIWFSSVHPTLRTRPDNIDTRNVWRRDCRTSDLFSRSETWEALRTPTPLLRHRVPGRLHYRQSPSEIVPRTLGPDRPTGRQSVNSTPRTSWSSPLPNRSAAARSAAPFWVTFTLCFSSFCCFVPPFSFSTPAPSFSPYT